MPPALQSVRPAPNAGAFKFARYGGRVGARARVTLVDVFLACVFRFVRVLLLNCD